jgi:hypothetical protein
MPRIDPQAFKLLGEKIRPPKAPPKHEVDESWMPDLNPTQLKAWNCDAKYLLLWGAKGGAKSFLGVSKLMKHCYENQNALALILVRTQNMAKKGGSWDMLIGEIAPKWKEGLGIQISDVKSDEQHFQYIWVENRHGGWSMICVMSSPHANQLRERIRGMVPSMVFVDELTSCPSAEYFEPVAAQLGRRPHVEGVQQYIGACNPEGPSHWVYQTWFVNPIDETTGAYDEDFAEIFFPKEENRERLPDGYFEQVAKIYRYNEVELARMAAGEWVDRPSGEGLFREIYNPVRHVHPIEENGRPSHRSRIQPNADHVMGLSIDPGSPNNAFVFVQHLPIGGKMKWVFFDEVVTIGRAIPYTTLIPLVMRRIRWWRDQVGKEMKQVWVADEASFNQYRAQSGSFDVMQFEQIYEANRVKYKLEPLGKIKACPKGDGSIVARVRLLQRLLSDDEIVVSSGCPKIHQMFLQLEGKKFKPGEAPEADEILKPIKSPHKHVFDAVSYMLHFALINPTALIPIAGSSQTLIRSAA